MCVSVSGCVSVSVGVRMSVGVGVGVSVRGVNASVRGVSVRKVCAYVCTVPCRTSPCGACRPASKAML